MKIFTLGRNTSSIIKDAREIGFLGSNEEPIIFAMIGDSLIKKSTSLKIQTNPRKIVEMAEKKDICDVFLVANGGTSTAYNTILVALLGQALLGKIVEIHKDFNTGEKELVDFGFQYPVVRSCDWINEGCNDVTITWDRPPETVASRKWQEEYRKQ